MANEFKIKNGVIIEGLSSVLKNHVLTYDTASGKVFYTASSAGGVNVIPGGPQWAIQFNSSSTFSGSNNFTFTSQSNTVNLTGSMIISGTYGNTLFEVRGGDAIIGTAYQLNTSDGTWYGGSVGIDIGQQYLYANDGISSIQWSNRNLLDINDNLALNWSDTGSSNGVRLYGTASYALTASHVTSLGIQSGKISSNFTSTPLSVNIPANLSSYTVDLIIKGSVSNLTNATIHLISGSTIVDSTSVNTGNIARYVPFTSMVTVSGSQSISSPIGSLNFTLRSLPIAGTNSASFHDVTYRALIIPNPIL